MSVSTESCYECGHDLPGDRGEPLYACLWDAEAMKLKT